MKPSSRDYELILRSARDELTPEEQTELSNRLRNRAELRKTLTSVTQTAELLNNGPRAAFSPGFANRVMERVHFENAGAPSMLSAALRHQFTRLVPATLVLAVTIGAYSLTSTRRTGQSDVDSLLGLDPVTFQSVYSPVAIAGGQVSEEIQ